MSGIKCMRDFEEIMSGELVDNIIPTILYAVDEIEVSDKSINELESLYHYFTKLSSMENYYERN